MVPSWFRRPELAVVAGWGGRIPLGLWFFVFQFATSVRSE